MSIATEIIKSVNKPLIAIQVDISQSNIQWVNIGAGIWYVSSLNDYPFVDPSLLDGFTAQDFGNIGSVVVDGVSQVQVYSLPELTNNSGRWYYDYEDRALYVCLPNYDEPFIHTIHIGVIYGYSNHDFTPPDIEQFYEGRLLDLPNIGFSRDPLFYGKISFESGSIILNNEDGEFDVFAEDHYIYGNEVRIYFGFPDINFADFPRLFTGVIGNISIEENQVNIQISDKRKNMTKAITYSCSALNALEAIEEIIESAYGLSYTSDIYDTVNWEIYKALVDTVSIDYEDTSAISMIEEICSSVFGIFFVNAEGKFSFRIVNENDPAESDIEYFDVNKEFKIDYDSSEVISSIKVGYAKDWSTTGNAYSYLTDNSREAEIYAKYKTYNQKESLTLLDTATAASAFAVVLYDYAEDVKGKININTGMEFYERVVGDNVNVEISNKNRTMLGMYKAEILNKSYDLNNFLIDWTIRLIRPTWYLVDDEGNYIITDEGYYIVL